MLNNDDRFINVGYVRNHISTIQEELCFLQKVFEACMMKYEEYVTNLKMSQEFPRSLGRTGIDGKRLKKTHFCRNKGLQRFQKVYALY
jgi:hypothetical protein